MPYIQLRNTGNIRFNGFSYEYTVNITSSIQDEKPKILKDLKNGLLTPLGKFKESVPQITNRIQIITLHLK